jgi:AraC-like DNA-binding protein
MSEATFFRYFKSVTGNTPIQYIKNIRLHKAKDLIMNEKMLLKEASKIV